jgi:NADH-quinone oxidoreductase subunit C
MTPRLQRLHDALQNVLANRLAKLAEYVNELTIEVRAADLLSVSSAIKEHPDLDFRQLTDLCGVDYKDYGNGVWDGPRFAVVYQLLSITHNVRLRLRTFAPDDAFPVVDSVVAIWPSANWYEREAFDFFGIVFQGHPDLRRILTDYGFVGYPFRKDFPVIGNVEMRYDPDQQRVIYQPVTIEPREVVPRIVRVENYGDVD